WPRAVQARYQLIKAGRSRGRRSAHHPHPGGEPAGIALCRFKPERVRGHDSQLPASFCGFRQLELDDFGHRLAPVGPEYDGYVELFARPYFFFVSADLFDHGAAALGCLIYVKPDALDRRTFYPIAIDLRESARDLARHAQRRREYQVHIIG